MTPKRSEIKQNGKYCSIQVKQSLQIFIRLKIIEKGFVKANLPQRPPVQNLMT